MSEFHTKLLDRLGSVKDFSEFLQTEAGARMVSELGSDQLSSGGPHERILRATQLSAVLGSLGLGLLVLWLINALPNQGNDALITIGVIAISLGVGFGVSAAASHRLAGSMGLLERAPSTRPLEAATRS